MERIAYLGRTIYRWQVGASSFLALPEAGARLMNWNVTLGDGTVRDILYWPEVRSMEEFARVRGGNPILFPFCGRSFDGGQVDSWRDDRGERRRMPRNGFARESAFRVIRLDGGGFSAQLEAGEEAKAAYPYDYEFVVSYRFEPLGVFVELQLTNLGRTPMPWSAGHHFYFTVPWSGGLNRDDYVLEVPAGRSVRQDFETGRLVDGPRLVARETLSDQELVDAIQTELRRPGFRLTEAPTGGGLDFDIGFTNTSGRDAAVVTWTAEDVSPYYCIEPWMGPPNGAETKVGLHHVGPGQTQKFTVEIRVR